MCVVEKAGFEPRTLGTGAERATNRATAPVVHGYKYYFDISLISLQVKQIHRRSTASSALPTQDARGFRGVTCWPGPSTSVCILVILCLTTCYYLGPSELLPRSTTPHMWLPDH